MLILSGHNNVSIQTEQCWLSPVALATMDDLSSQGPRHPCACYVFPQQGALLDDVLPKILLQLLRQKSHVLRDEKQRAELWAELHEFRKYGGIEPDG